MTKLGTCKSSIAEKRHNSAKSAEFRRKTASDLLAFAPNVLAVLAMGVFALVEGSGPLWVSRSFCVYSKIAAVTTAAMTMRITATAA